MAKLLVGKYSQHVKALLVSEHERGALWSSFLYFDGEYSEFLIH